LTPSVPGGIIEKGSIIYSEIIQGFVFQVAWSSFLSNYAMFWSLNKTGWKHPNGSGQGNGVYYSGSSVSGGLVEIEDTYDGGLHKAILIGGQNGRISSIDYKKNIKFYNGSGTGLYYYSSGVLLTNTINKIVKIGVSVFFQGDSQGASLDNITTWKTSAGAGSGVGPYFANYTTIFAAALTCTNCLVVDNILFLISTNNTLANWRPGSGATNSNGTGAGLPPFNNTTNKISAGSLPSIPATIAAVFKNQFIANSYTFIGSFGEASTATGSSWKFFDGTFSGVNTGYFNGVSGGNSGILCSCLIEAPKNPLSTSLINHYLIGGLNGVGQFVEISGTILKLTETTSAFNCLGKDTNALITKLFDDDLKRACLYPYNGDVFLCILDDFTGGSGSGRQGSLSSLNLNTGLWKYSDGTGTGDGPYMAAGSHLGATTTAATRFFLCAYKNYLVVSGNDNRICSFEGQQYKTYLGAGTGSGPYDNGTLIGTGNTIYVLKEVNNFLIVAGVSGRLGSYDGNGYKTYLGVGSGLGPFDNGVIVSTDAIVDFLRYKNGVTDNYIFVGNAGKIGSRQLNDYSLQRTYAGVGTGNGPYSNAAVTSTAALCATQYKNFLIIANGEVGTETVRVGSWDGVAWINYLGVGSGTGPYLNLTNNDPIQPKKVFEFQGSLYIFCTYLSGSTTGTSVLIKYNGKTWESVEDKDDKIYSNYLFSDILFFNGCFAAVSPFGAVVITNGKRINNTNLKAFCYDAGLLFSYPLAFSLPDNSRGDIFAYESLQDQWAPNNAPIFINIENNQSRVAIFTKEIITLPYYCKNAISRQVGANYPTNTNIIISNDGNTSENKALPCFQIVETTLGTIQAVNIGNNSNYNVMSMETSESGPGYIGGSFLASESVYVSFYGLDSVGNSYIEVVSNSDYLPGNRGRLSSKLLTDGGFFSIPVNGFLGAYSYALDDDSLGVLLSPVGEALPTYSPQTLEGTISYLIYKSNQGHVLIAIGATPANRIQRITSELYKINTVSPYNILNVKTRSLFIGSADYNGRAILTDTDAKSAIAFLLVSQMLQKYSSGIDTGEKTIYITDFNNGNITIPGARVLSGSNNEALNINIYLDGDYIQTIDETGASEYVSEFDGTLYIPDTREPAVAWGVYGSGAVDIGGETFLLFPDFDGYAIGGGLDGQYQYFNLFGQDYICNAENIYSVTLIDGLVSQKLKIANKSGLTFATASPTAAFFFSLFDNSIYSFDGGRALTKIDKYNRHAPIVKGVFSVHENALWMETETDFITSRDGMKTTISKPAGLTSARLYNTVSGVVYGDREKPAIGQKLT